MVLRRLPKSQKLAVEAGDGIRHRVPTNELRARRPQQHPTMRKDPQQVSLLGPAPGLSDAATAALLFQDPRRVSPL